MITGPQGWLDIEIALLSGLVAGGMCAVPAVVNCAEFVAKAAIEEREYILLGIAKRE
jgi:hypothetical protein